MEKDFTLEAARRVLDIEAAAVMALKDRLNSDFATAVDMILAGTGKVVVTGMGKSGLICQKIASTLASTGTSAFFLHPAEGAHGDVGVLMANDIVLALSNSGETEEIVKMVPLVKRLGIKMIAMTGSAGSTLSRYADLTLDIGVKEEACPLGLAPTASTTAALAMGDALAVALLQRRGFKQEDFKNLHPAGSLGKKLMKVEEIMHTGEAIPRVGLNTPMKDTILEMTEKRLGIAGVFDPDGAFVGVITDGDLRRALERDGDIRSLSAEVVMTRNPKLVKASFIAEAALKQMEEHSITVLFVSNEDGSDVVGVLHLHDLMKAGVI